jgi:hypothetical protein
MTPPITKEIMASRPLYDPDPNTFVARDIIKELSMRRVRLSDFAVVALQINIREGFIKHAEADIFENVFIRGARPRATRIHEGRPSRAPDNSIMSHLGVAYPGSTDEAAGAFSTQDVRNCTGYEAWVKRITQSEEDLVARGVDVRMKNQPLPDPAALEVANAYVLKKMNIRRKSEETVGGEDSDDEKPDASNQRAKGTTQKRKSAGKGKERETVQDSGDENAGSGDGAAKERVLKMIAEAEGKVARTVFRISGLGNILGDKQRAAMTLKLERKLKRRMQDELAFAWKQFPERKPSWMAEDGAGASASKGNDVNGEAEEVAVATGQADAMESAVAESGAGIEPEAGVESELGAGISPEAGVEDEASVEGAELEGTTAGLEEQEVGIGKGAETEAGAGQVRSTDAGGSRVSESSASASRQEGKRGRDEVGENGEARPKKHARHHMHSMANPPRRTRKQLQEQLEEAERKARLAGGNIEGIDDPNDEDYQPDE